MLGSYSLYGRKKIIFFENILEKDFDQNRQIYRTESMIPPKSFIPATQGIYNRIEIIPKRIQ